MNLTRGESNVSAYHPYDPKQRAAAGFLNLAQVLQKHPTGMVSFVYCNHRTATYEDIGFDLPRNKGSVEYRRA